MLAANRATTEIVQLAARRSGLEQLVGSTRRVPFHVAVAAELTPPTASWLGSAAPKPISAGALETIDGLTPTKLSGILIVTDELARVVSAEQALAQSIARALAAMQDEAFFGTAAATADSPAGVFNGALTIASSGDPVGDASALLEAFGGDLSSSFWVMSAGVAASLALRGAQFQDLSTRGGGCWRGSR